METLPVSIGGERTLEELRMFLGAVRDGARQDGHYKVVSISAEIPVAVDPLAVLDTIYADEDLHAYFERRECDFALAAAEGVLSGHFSGPARFVDARQWAEGVLEHTIAAGELEHAWAGPRFFTAFTFADAVDEGSVFAPATVWLPHWQVVRDGGRTFAVANVKVEPESDVDAAAERLWRAHGKFGEISANAADGAEDPGSSENRYRFPEAGGGEEYKAAVRAALDAIGRQDYEKIVLSRALDIEMDRPLRAVDALNRLREAYPGCCVFSFSNATARSFIGATPERLVSKSGVRVQTEAIAGTVGRGGNQAEDAALAQGLLCSDKDMREHRAVVESIIKRLSLLGMQGEAEARPRLLPLANVQHLITPVKAEAPAEMHVLDVLKELHPTPAVGGKPRGDALPAIRGLEGYDRGLYAGALGWFDHGGDGEFYVSIRSALIDGRNVRVYAGAGIVAGSEPAREFRETELKMQALLDALG